MVYRCVRRLLAEKSVVLVTHQTQYLERCHSVLRLMEVGCTCLFNECFSGYKCIITE